VFRQPNAFDFALSFFGILRQALDERRGPAARGGIFEDWNQLVEEVGVRGRENDLRVLVHKVGKGHRQLTSQSRERRIAGTNLVDGGVVVIPCLHFSRHLCSRSIKPIDSRNIKPSLPRFLCWSGVVGLFELRIDGCDLSNTDQIELKVYVYGGPCVLGFNGSM
jgi:hypothetical protein